MHATRWLLLLVVSQLLLGCRTPARYVGYGVLYPVQEHFTLKGKFDPRQMSLDTSKTYVRKVEYIHEPIIDYNYLRFWPDGRCFWGTAAYDQLDRHIVESLRVGEPGYFVIKGDDITMENFSPEYSGSYALSRGKLLKDKDGNIRIRILETRYIGGFSFWLFPHFCG